MKRMSLLSILLILCCLFVGCSSFSKHTVTNTKEIRTETFLEKPEQMVRIRNGNEEQLSSETLDSIYNGFTELMAVLQQTDALKTPFQSEKVKEWKKEYTCFEFRYAQRRNYVGALDDEESLFPWGELQFDAFLFIYYSEGLIAVPYIEDDYVGINNLFLFLTFPEEKINKFINMI